MVCTDHADETSTCQFAAEADPCSADVLCEPGLYCSEFDICKKPYEEDGHWCLGVHPQECAWPMSCICVTGGQCECYDGTVGDPCKSDTCAQGLYCHVLTISDDVGKCVEGSTGDPCTAGWQCDDPLDCVLHDGKSVCGRILEEGAECTTDEGDPKICAEGLVCNAALDPPTCVPPGEDGAPCETTADCAPGFHCNAAHQQCFDGDIGEPCATALDCQPGLTCLDNVDGGLTCTATQGLGTVCEFFSQFQECEPGLVCNAAYDPHLCLTPGLDLDPCTKDGDCIAGGHCQPELSACFSGDNGDPCGGKSCAEGFACIAGLELCSNGTPGAPCATHGDCAPELTCIGMWDSPACIVILKVGDPCAPDVAEFSICPPGSVCDASQEIAVCKEAVAEECAEGSCE